MFTAITVRGPPITAGGIGEAYCIGVDPDFEWLRIYVPGALA